ncbi:hypothetical protein V0U79_06965 [Hyphobacterium sp. HN65]|uniref:Uncharacterized protein n=1 Tax=Hyphobacterium lacteum TaxID=3116575 RepID=A0ABU7LQB8_9PROT|nr:hypothetical protein [Hyphobacterium sp. HN65]MEE2526102.1 hypothetical protein [Hyphobacterium sp. HN65]
MLSLIAAVSLSLSPPAVGAPVDFHFGAGPETHDFDAICDSHIVREFDIAEMPLATTSHVQVDCQGYDYFGAERLAEFVFADGALTHVWVLVEESELDDLQSDFESAFGAPDARAPVFAAFFSARAAVRRDIPEALYYSEAAAPLFEAFFSGNR